MSADYSLGTGGRTWAIGADSPFQTPSVSFSLLCRVGEKFLLWSDDDPSLDTILESLSLYWFTDTISTSFYCYRDVSPTAVAQACA